MGLSIDVSAILRHMCMLSMIDKDINQNLVKNLLHPRHLASNSCMKCNDLRPIDHSVVSLKIRETIFKV